MCTNRGVYTSGCALIRVPSVAQQSSGVKLQTSMGRWDGVGGVGRWDGVGRWGGGMV